MESFKGGLKGYWKRRGYHRIDGGSQGRRRPAQAELGGGGGHRRRRRFWRIKISPRLRFLRAVSPRRILARIRDAYVRMMLSFASAAPLGVAYGDYYAYGAYGAYGGAAAMRPPPLKEYDEKVLVEIYKKFIAATVTSGGASAGAIVLRS